MATTLTADGILFPSGTELITGGAPRSIRWTSTTAATQIAASSGDTYMQLEVIMPPAVDSNSVYLVWAKSGFDDSNSDTRGIGLSIWVEQSNGNGNSQWVSRQGYHCQYTSGGRDYYMHQHHTILDMCGGPASGGGGAYGSSPAVRAGDERKYRVYNLQNNSNMIGNCNYVSRQEDASGMLVVLELDGGSLLVPGYGA
jgi:hypothetical protein